jgi:uncharacterized protein (TIGR03032 family)
LRAGPELTDLTAAHEAAWRDPAAVTSGWLTAGRVDSRLLKLRTRGAWWDLLDRLGVTLLVSREYEHLLLAMCTVEGKPHVTYLQLPHPSGIAVDAERAVVHVAGTRNPNQLFELAPVRGSLSRRDAPAPQLEDAPLVPIASRVFPGALYLHDLALIAGRLHGNAVGLNAVVDLSGPGGFEPVWWPRAIERHGKPDFELNHLQLNSIAAGPTVSSSYYSASAIEPGRRRPGHVDFPVDRRGAIFDGASREPVVTGLTRPHSARLRGRELWVDNSGYGETGVVVDGTFTPVRRFDGWTRGLCFCGEIAFVGVSLVLPRFRRYAPGIDADRSECGVHAIDVRSGATLASITWPFGNQIFGIEAIPRAVTHGLPFGAGRTAKQIRELFYGFSANEGGT